jgi:hypothetical protein
MWLKEVSILIYRLARYNLPLQDDLDCEQKSLISGGLNAGPTEKTGGHSPPPSSRCGTSTRTKTKTTEKERHFSHCPIRDFLSQVPCSYGVLCVAPRAKLPRKNRRKEKWGKLEAHFRGKCRRSRQRPARGRPAYKTMEISLLVRHYTHHLLDVPDSTPSFVVPHRPYRHSNTGT